MRKANQKNEAALPPRPYHHGGLRPALLEAAEELLGGQGIDGLSLRAVSRRAGVSHAAAYHHFKSRQDLLAAVAQRGFLALTEAMARASQTTDAKQRLIALCGVYVQQARLHPDRFRLMFGPLLARKTEHPELEESSRQAFQSLLEAAAEHDPVSGLDMALACWSLAHGLAHLQIDGALNSLPVDSPNVEGLPERLAEVVLHRHASEL